MAARRLALGFSGGGDSTALLLALRAALPDVDLHALIVDHALRPESAGEAAEAARFAEAAGARARILRWADPQPGQARAREARHRLLAVATAQIGAPVLCLGHTLDDRIETLRMRAARPGGELRMAGPGPVDASPVWPEGAGLILARPLLGLTRERLRSYLRTQGADWIEDPSNADPAYERVRLRLEPLSGREEIDLLRRSDAAQRERDRLNDRARTLIGEACALEPWGGLRLDSRAFGAARRAVALKAMEALALAASGRVAPPSPASLAGLLDALIAGRAASAGGAHLTASGVLGRDAGAAGRADGSAGAAALELAPGGRGVFDGRWRVSAHRAVSVSVLGERHARPAPDVPPALRPGLAVLRDAATGEPLGVAGRDPLDGVDVEGLARERIDARLLPLKPPTWFDGAKIAAHVRAGLAKPGRRPNMKRDEDALAPVQAAHGASRGEEET